MHLALRFFPIGCGRGHATPNLQKSRFHYRGLPTAAASPNKSSGDTDPESEKVKISFSGVGDNDAESAKVKIAIADFREPPPKLKS